MRQPVTIEVQPIGEEQKHAHQLLWSGLALIITGILLLIAPHSLNLIIASLFIIFGVAQLLINKWQGPLLNKSTGWITIGIGLLLFIFPKLLNYFLILLFIGVTIVVVIFFIRLEARLWTLGLVVTALVGGIFMLSFPMAINIVFAIYIILTGLQQLLLCYQSYYRWQWFQ